jgi:hypothetical protein
MTYFAILDVVELPSWMWLVVAWCLFSVGLTLALGRWFRFIKVRE